MSFRVFWPRQPCAGAALLTTTRFGVICTLDFRDECMVLLILGRLNVPARGRNPGVHTCLLLTLAFARSNLTPTTHKNIYVWAQSRARMPAS